jgi:hypothetical protein
MDGGISDEHDVRTVPPDDLVRWLIVNQPAGPSSARTNWYLRMAVRLGVCTATVDRERLARVYEVACTEGAFSADETAIRLARLSARHGAEKAAAEGDAIANLDPDRVARRCLALIPIPPTQAAERARQWRLAPVATIRSLRRIKELLRPVIALLPLIRDAELATEVSAWKEVFERLP